MQVHDRRKFARCRDLGHELADRPGRHRGDHGVAGQDRLAAARRHQRGDTVRGALEAADLGAEADIDAALIEHRERRRDEGVGKAAPGDQRRRFAGALGQRLADHRQQQPRRRLVRRRVEDGDGERLPETVEERPLRAKELAHRPVAGIEQPQPLDIFGKRGAAHPPVLVENPPRHRSAIDVDGPAFARFEVEEGEDGALRPAQPVAGADAVEIAERCPIARQHQMIAIVDLGLEQRVVP